MASTSSCSSRGLGVLGAAATLLVAGVAFGAVTAAHAQGGALPAPQNVLNLQASAAVEVTKDILAISFTATRDGSDAATVQAQIKQALDAALAEARKAARPQQLEVRTGNFSMYPRYSQKGGINGWQGSAEMTVEGRDMPAIAQLAGRIQTMTIARVSYALSREAQEKVEADVTAQAIRAFQQKAAEAAKQFGFSNVAVREVHLQTSEPQGGGMPKAYMRSAAMAAEDAPLPVEAGKGTVTATVSGSVQMK